MRHARERHEAADDPTFFDSSHTHTSSKMKEPIGLGNISLGGSCNGDERVLTAALDGNVSGRSRRHVEHIFHPELRRTKEVIRRPEWVRRTGECVAHRGSLSTVALFGIMFANCVGGGYGFEDGISSAGPLITLIVCAILPWLWAFPTGLAVAELSTAVPSNSGVLMWTNAAFPPFISFMCILATVFITFIGNATYPNLTAEYVQKLSHLSAGAAAGVKIGVVALCCLLNCVGVEIVGSSSIILCTVTILPFMLLTVIQLFSRGFNAAVLHVDVKKVRWADFFSIISWNYANIENAGAVVEEVANPRKAFPKAMMLLMLSTYAAYVMPMLAGVSAMGVDQDYSKWEAGHWPEVAGKIAGDWLKYMLFSGAILSGVGFTLTSMCCTSRLLAGMGTMHMFPKKLSRVIGYYHPRLGTPIPAIVINSCVTLIFSVSMDFTRVVSLCQSIYCLRMLLIYASLIKLRIDYPNLPRPYALPFSTWKTVLVLLPAAAFSLMASIVSAMTSIGIGIALVSFVVVGNVASWLYCRVFARNGFQGVIVQCEVSSGEDADAGADDNADDDFLSEGVFYVDDDPNNGEPADDLLLGILPIPPAEPAGAQASPASMRENGGGARQQRQRPGMKDPESACGCGEGEMTDVEITVQGGASPESLFVNNSVVAFPNGSSVAVRSPIGGFSPYGVPPSHGMTMRHRRNTRSVSGGGDAPGSCNTGPVVTGEDSGEEGDINPMDRSDRGFSLSAVGVSTQVPLTPTASPHQVIISSPTPGSRTSSRTLTPVKGHHGSMRTHGRNSSTFVRSPLSNSR